ncbi:hypothetical protein ABMA27_015484 [Loxostege sticticalis]|uniref:Odorant receptor n=1 Tax=Loxostege sticticalis TaxID=481309 RepID=A0ABR3I7V9_LOXSC
MADCFKVKTSRVDALRHNVLVWGGIYKLHTKKYYLGVCHDVYRVFVIVMLILVNIQHIIYIYLRAIRGEDVPWDIILLVITMIDLIIKVVTINIHSKQIDEIHDLIKAPMFDPTCTEDKIILKKNEKQINVLLKTVYINVTVLNISYNIYTIGQRVKDESAVIPAYYPFDTNPWSGYLLAFLFEWASMSLWCGYGLALIDCSVACYYTRAATQLKIVNYHLERLFDDVKIQNHKRFQYKDVLDRSLNLKFIYYIQRYQNVYRLIDTVNTAFKGGIAFQFFSVTVCLSFCIYKMSYSDIFSVEFQFALALVLHYQLHNFLYCYFGNLVEHESELVCTSMYFSDWPSASPRFRRQMLIAMARWARPITPRVSIVPVTMATFESTVRLSYTLYTVLKSRSMTMN